MNTEFFRRFCPTLGRWGDKPGGHVPKVKIDLASPGLPARRVLLVDDDLVVLTGLGNALRSRGYNVVEAVDVSAAISALKEFQPDAVLMDMNFPPDPNLGGGWDGIQAMLWLRMMGGVGSAPFIMITATALERERQRAVAAGAYAYRSKPVDPNDLSGLIERAILDRSLLRL